LPPATVSGRRLVLMVSAVVLLALPACDDGDPLYGVGGGGGSTPEAELAILEITGGDQQNGRTSEAFGLPLVVQATVDLGVTDGIQANPNIQPATGLEIDWSITRGVATLSAAASFTDDDGEAFVTVTSGPLLGDLEVAAAVAGGMDTVRFELRTTVYLIDILINRFEVPLGGDSLEVVVGDTVEWVNRDVLRHAVLATSVPPGGFEFFSPELDNSQRYRFVPKVEGVFDYEDPLSDQPILPTGRISVVGREVGALRVETTTSGENRDNAYVVTVDGTRSSAIGADDQVIFPALGATAHAVRLREVAPNCVVGGDNPLAVTVAAGDTVTTTFGVTCE
jgi:plastocyanin